jgi:hypothetical protein
MDSLINLNMLNGVGSTLGRRRDVSWFYLWYNRFILSALEGKAKLFWVFEILVFKSYKLSYVRDMCTNNQCQIDRTPMLVFSGSSKKSAFWTRMFWIVCNAFSFWVLVAVTFNITAGFINPVFCAVMEMGQWTANGWQTVWQTEPGL